MIERLQKDFLEKIVGRITDLEKYERIVKDRDRELEYVRGFLLQQLEIEPGFSNISIPENKYTRFKEGVLEVKRGDCCSGKVDLDRSAVYYGQDRRSFYKGDHRFILPLCDLKILNEKKFSWKYHRVNAHMEIRKTITGGLKVKRMMESKKDFIIRASFSREEYEEMKKYLT